MRVACTTVCIAMTGDKDFLYECGAEILVEPPGSGWTWASSQSGTTGDSSLSACIQSIVAFELGYDEIALTYLISALLMDLGDASGNVRDGCHIASMGGTWMGGVYGLAGLRDHGGRLSFHPNRSVEALAFRLIVRGQQLAVRIEAGRVTYLLETGTELTIHHREERLDLRRGESVTR
jgi:alpha,alpha-trehalose phosphorylase